MLLLEDPTNIVGLELDDSSLFGLDCEQGDAEDHSESHRDAEQDFTIKKGKGSSALGCLQGFVEKCTGLYPSRPRGQGSTQKVRS